MDTSTLLEEIATCDFPPAVTVPVKGLPLTPKLVKHPVAALYNLSSYDKGGENNAFVDDIRENGQRVPIVIFEGKLLDGSRRYDACLALGLEPTITVYTGDDPLAEVMSLNGHRRQLTKTQFAAMKALNADPEQQAKHGGPRGRAGAHLVAASSQASEVGCGPTTQREVNRIVKENRDLALQMAAGTLSLTEAKAIVFPEKAVATAVTTDTPVKRKGGVDHIAEQMSSQIDSLPPHKKMPAKIVKLFQKLVSSAKDEIEKRDVRIETLEAEVLELRFAAASGSQGRVTENKPS